MRDVLYDPSLKPVSDTGLALVDAVASAHNLMRKRKPKGAIGDLRACVVANLAVHHLGGEPGGVQVARAKQRKKAADRPVDRYAASSFPTAFPHLLDGLVELEMIRQDVGIYSGNRSLARLTVIYADERLVELIGVHGVTRADFSAGGETGELIILSRKKARRDDTAVRRVQYDDDETTRAYRRQIEGLNDWLGRADVTYDGRPKAAGPMRRNFNNERFDHGGRLSGGWWENISKEDRRRSLRIAGESVVGVDYASMYPALLYWLANARQPDGDAYEVSGFERYRPAVKTVFNSLLFGGGKKFPQGLRAKHAIPKRMKYREFLEAILAKHCGVASYLTGSEIGYELMFHESQLLLSVLEACQRRTIVALPVHDCIYVGESYAAEAQQIMEAQSKGMTGRVISAKVEG